MKVKNKKVVISCLIISLAIFIPSSVYFYFNEYSHFMWIMIIGIAAVLTYLMLIITEAPPKYHKAANVIITILSIVMDLILMDASSAYNVPMLKPLAIVGIISAPITLIFSWKNIGRSNSSQSFSRKARVIEKNYISKKKKELMFEFEDSTRTSLIVEADNNLIIGDEGILTWEGSNLIKFERLDLCKLRKEEEKAAAEAAQKIAELNKPMETFPSGDGFIYCPRCGVVQNADRTKCFKCNQVFKFSE